MAAHCSDRLRKWSSLFEIAGCRNVDIAEDFVDVLQGLVGYWLLDRSESAHYPPPRPRMVVESDRASRFWGEPYVEEVVEIFNGMDL